MATPGAGRGRDGKYCPRCQAMTVRDRETCGQCGHRFRTGLPSAGSGLTGVERAGLDAPLPEDARNRTMQFTLPPLAPRLPEPPRLPDAPPSVAPPAARSGRRAIFAAVAGMLACAAAFAAWHARPVPAASPVGGWETTLAGRSARAAPGGVRLRLIFRDGGGGAFSWADAGGSALAGQAPLQWRLASGGRLALIVAPPAPADPVSETLTGVLNGRPWPWRVDRPHHRLRLGTMDFQEINFQETK